MNAIVKIALLHILFFVSQAFYMYLSNKPQLKKHRYLYLIAVPIATVFPTVIYSQDPQIYDLYEYAIVFCIIAAAMVDVTLAAGFGREYLTDKTGRSLTYSYFLICTATAFAGSTSIAVRAITLFLLAGSLLIFVLVKKHSAVELIAGIPLALVSVICSWAFLHFGM